MTDSKKMITIPLKRYMWLCNKMEILNALIVNGVSTWQGYNEIDWESLYSYTEEDFYDDKRISTIESED